MKSQSTERIAGYVFLALGLFFIILPSSLAISILIRGAQIPTFIPILSSGQNDTTNAFIVFSNACLVLFLLAIPVWAGSIISSRGVAMVKDVKLKLMGKSVREAAEPTDKLDS